MARRGECIYKRRDGRWEARYLSCDAYGKKVYRSVYARSYREAKEKKIQALLQKKTLVCQGAPFEALLEQWLEQTQLRLKPQTFQKYAQCIRKHIIPYLGSLPCKQIDRQTIQRFLIEKSNSGRLDGTGGLSNNYLRLLTVILCSVLEFGAKEQMLPPIAGQITKPKAVRREILVLSESEQVRMEDMIGKDVCVTHTAVFLALHLGLRLGEICALRWSDVDWSTNVLHISRSVVRTNSAGASFSIGTPKSATSDRYIPLPETVLQWLLTAKELSDSPYIVSGKNGEFLNPRTMESRYAELQKRLCINHTPFHTLRHTFATRCIERGVDVKSLSEILGHSNVSTTLSYYVHSSMQQKRHALELFEGNHGQKTGQQEDKVLCFQ